MEKKKNKSGSGKKAIKTLHKKENQQKKKIQVTDETSTTLSKTLSNLITG